MKSLIIALAVWIAAQTGYEIPKEIPTIRTVKQGNIIEYTDYKFILMLKRMYFTLRKYPRISFIKNGRILLGTIRGK